jgi:hypothetical protein
MDIQDEASACRRFCAEKASAFNKSQQRSTSGSQRGQGANLSEGDSSDSPSKRGILYLEVHRENGKLRLARNESADWYYDRVQ